MKLKIEWDGEWRLRSKVAILIATFCIYLSTGQPETLVVFLTCLWLAILPTSPKKLNRIYYLASFFILTCQSLILIYIYQFKVIYLQITYQYVTYVLGIITFIITLAWFVYFLLKKSVK